MITRYVDWIGLKDFYAYSGRFWDNIVYGRSLSIIVDLLFYEICVLTRQESLSNFPAQIFLSSYNFSVKVGLLTKIFVFVCTLEYLTVHKCDNWKKKKIFTSAAHTYLYIKVNPLISNFRFSSSKNSQERRLTMLRTAVTCPAPYLAGVLGVPEHPRNSGVRKRGKAWFLLIRV